MISNQDFFPKTKWIISQTILNNSRNWISFNHHKNPTSLKKTILFSKFKNRKLQRTSIIIRCMTEYNYDTAHSIPQQNCDPVHKFSTRLNHLAVHYTDNFGFGFGSNMAFQCRSCVLFGKFQKTNPQIRQRFQ